MKLTFKRNNEVLDSAIEEEIDEREKEFRDKYENSQISSYIIVFKDGVWVKDVNSLDDIHPKTVEEIIVELK